MTGKLRKHLDTQPARRQRGKHPEGWEPGYHDDGNTVTVTTKLTQPPQADTWRALLEAEGYDPDQYHIKADHGVQHRKWQQREDGEYLRYFRFTAIRNDAREWDLDDLIKLVRKRKKRNKPADPQTGGAALVVNLADWQAGADHGGGPEPLAERIQALGPAVIQRWRHLRKTGVPLDRLYIHSGGDMGENCAGHYAQQAFRTTLTMEEQREFVIHALDSLIEQWLGLAPISVYAIPGNHGEQRLNDKSFTDFRDNVDIGVWVNLAHAYSKNPERYGHIQIHTPVGQDLHLTYEHDGYITTLIHGHQALGGGDPAKKLDTWWRGQMAGMQPPGDADLLITNHFHHFRIVQQGRRTHMMCPALCGTQDWWVNASGLDSPPATLTYVVTGNGWDHIHLIE